MIKKIFFILFMLLPNLSQASLDDEQKHFLKLFLSLNRDEERMSMDILSDLESGDLVAKVIPSEPRVIHLNKSSERFTAAEVRGVVVHEAVHLLTYKRKKAEGFLVSEGSALLAEFLFDLKHEGKLQAFRSFASIIFAGRSARASDFDIENANLTADNYGRAFLFYLFLYSSFGREAFTQENFHARGLGMEGILKALRGEKIETIGMDISKQFIVSQFIESLQARRNLLATESNDLFSQALQI